MANEIPSQSFQLRLNTVKSKSWNGIFIEGVELTVLWVIVAKFLSKV